MGLGWFRWFKTSPAECSMCSHPATGHRMLAGRVDAPAIRCLKQLGVQFYGPPMGECPGDSEPTRSPLPVQGQFDSVDIEISWNFYPIRWTHGLIIPLTFCCATDVWQHQPRNTKVEHSSSLRNSRTKLTLQVTVYWCIVNSSCVMDRSLSRVWRHLFPPVVRFIGLKFP